MRVLSGAEELIKDETKLKKAGTDQTGPGDHFKEFVLHLKRHVKTLKVCRPEAILHLSQLPTEKRSLLLPGKLIPTMQKQMGFATLSTKHIYIPTMSPHHGYKLEIVPMIFLSF